MNIILKSVQKRKNKIEILNENKYTIILVLGILIFSLINFNLITLPLLIILILTCITRHFDYKNTLNYYMKSDIKHLIEDNRKNEWTILKSEEKFRRFFENSNIPMCIFDRKLYIFTDVNKAFCECLGYSKDELIQINFKGLIHKTTRDKHKSRYFINYFLMF
jgi:PAS domain-containing protein